MRRLLIIGSQAFAAEAMRLGLRHAAGLNVFGVIGSGTDVVDEARRVRPDIIVVDGVSDGDRALHCLPQIRAGVEGALMLVVLDDASAEDKARVLDAGAVAWVWPGARNRLRGVRQEAGNVRRLRVAGRSALEVPRRPAALTSRELETLAWVAEGHTNAWIARKLWVTEQTVKFHLTNIYRKLGVTNRTEAAHYAIRHGLVSHAGSDVGLPGSVGLGLPGAVGPTEAVTAADTPVFQR